MRVGWDKGEVGGGACKGLGRQEGGDMAVH